MHADDDGIGLHGLGRTHAGNRISKDEKTCDKDRDAQDHDHATIAQCPADQPFSRKQAGARTGPVAVMQRLIWRGLLPIKGPIAARAQLPPS